MSSLHFSRKLETVSESDSESEYKSDSEMSEIKDNIIISSESDHDISSSYSSDNTITNTQETLNTSILKSSLQLNHNSNSNSNSNSNNNSNSDHFNFKMGIYVPYITEKHLRLYSTGQGIIFDKNYENKIKHFITRYFTLNYGEIRRVDVVKRSNAKGTFYSAFVHFVGWLYNEETVKLQYQLNNNIQSKFSWYFPNNDGWFWYLRKHNNPEQYNNPEHLLSVIKKQEQQINDLSNQLSQINNVILNQELPRKKQRN